MNSFHLLAFLLFTFDSLLYRTCCFEIINSQRMIQTTVQRLKSSRRIVPLFRLFSLPESSEISSPDPNPSNYQEPEDLYGGRVSKKKKLMYQRSMEDLQRNGDSKRFFSTSKTTERKGKAKKGSRKEKEKEKGRKQAKKVDEKEEDEEEGVLVDVSGSEETHNNKEVDKTMFGLVIERYLNRFLVQRLIPISSSNTITEANAHGNNTTLNDDDNIEYQRQLEIDFNYTHKNQHERALYNLKNYFLCYPSSKMMYESSVSVVPGDYISFYTFNEVPPGMKELTNTSQTHHSDQNISDTASILESENGRTYSRRIPPYPSLPLNHYQAGWITHALPRSNLLARPSSSSESRKKVVFKSIASNVTQLFILVASRPYVPLPTIDRYLITAKMLEIPKVHLVINKYDLGEESEELYHELLFYEKVLGTKILRTSNQDHTGINDIKDLLINQTSVFVGQSGVGKSSLINALLPHLSIKANPLTGNEQFGAHTTSNARLYHFYDDEDKNDINSVKVSPPLRHGVIIDSPGIREMGTWHLTLADIVSGFDEIYDYSKECKFRNCNHLEYNGEKNCAVYRAVKEGDIHESRYKSFLQLIKQIGYAH